MTAEPVSIPCMDWDAFHAALLPWYEGCARDVPWRATRDPYAIWVSEVMLQQTRVETVIPYYLRFLGAFPDIAALARADEQEVLRLWQGLGYYRRARLLHQGARAVLERGAMPSTHNELLALPGVGAYTAGAIASIAFGEATPAVDGNALRVFARWLALRESIDRPAGERVIHKAAANAIPARAPGIWNQAVMELGATICKPSSPRCADCPVASLCTAYAAGCAAELPLRAAKPAPLTEHWAVAIVLCDDGRVLIEQRPKEGLLARMWLFPMVRDAGMRALGDFLSCAGLSVRPAGRLSDAVHRFTHRVWRMRGWRFLADEPTCPPGMRWVTRGELAEAPIPAAVRVYLEAALSDERLKP